MARVNLGPVISSIHGKVGGGVFQKSRGCHTLRANRVPVNMRTHLLRNTRGSQFTVLQSWKKLTNAQRTEWEQFADLAQVPMMNNPDRVLNGQQLYVKGNYYMQRLSLPLLISPAFKLNELTPIDATVTRTFNFVTVTWSRLINPFNEHPLLYLSARVNDSIQNSGRRLRFVTVPVILGHTIEVTEWFIQNFGAMPNTGDKIFMRLTTLQRSNNLFIKTSPVKITIL